MKDMQVAEYHYEDFGDENDPKSDWALFMANFTFAHKEACEFIIYIGDEEIKNIEKYSELGFSKTMLSICKQAKELNFKYVCFYT